MKKDAASELNSSIHNRGLEKILVKEDWKETKRNFTFLLLFLMIVSTMLDIGADNELFFYNAAIFKKLRV